MADLRHHPSRPVSRNQITADGVAVVGQIHHHSRQASLPADGQHLNQPVRIALGPDNIGIADAGVGGDAAGLHPEPTDKRMWIVFDCSIRKFSRSEIGESAFDRVRRQRTHPFDLLRQIAGGAVETGSGVGMGG